MAVLSTYAPTLVDVVKRMEPDGGIATTIAEMLAQRNGIIEDIPMYEGNLETGHRCTIRTGLPTPAWRLLNQGVQPSKSTTAQVDEGVGILEAWSEVDCDVAELGGNAAAFRLSEAQAHVEAMNQEYAQTLFYGNSSISPNEFLGLSPRYSSLSAENVRCIIDAGVGSGGDNSSIWLINWGPQSIFGIYPKASKGGLSHEDLGKQVVQTSTDVAGTRLQVYQDKFQMKTGLVVKDWRFAVRIANIDVSNLTGNTSADDLIELMISAMHRIETLQGKPVWYMNRTLHHMLDSQSRQAVQSGGQLTYKEVHGSVQTSFRGVPIKVCDQLTEAETAVS